MNQSQEVVATRLADRHADVHGRDFAESRQVIVCAGSLGEVLLAALGELDDLPPGRYSITVSEPYDTP